MDIPDNKRFFRIGEVGRIIGVKTYVLRFWEKEFSVLKPRRTNAKQRVYQREDIEKIAEIRRLLYDEKLTIKGARNRLKSGNRPMPEEYSVFLGEIKKELEQLLKILQ